MAGGRTVDHDQVVVAAALELLDLAEHHDVVDARARRGDHVDDPAAGQTLGHPGQTVCVEVLAERGRRPRCAAPRRRVAGWSSVGLPSSSTTSTRRPRRIAARATTAVTVVFPTPPLPATTATRAVETNCSGSTLFLGGTCAQTSDHPSPHPARGAGRAVAARTRSRTPPPSRRTPPVPARPRTAVAGGRPGGGRPRSRSTCCRSPVCSTTCR